MVYLEWIHFYLVNFVGEKKKFPVAVLAHAFYSRGRIKINKTIF